MKSVVIAGYVRSPFHFARKGALAKVRPDDMAGLVVKGLVDRAGIDPAEIEDIIVGCAFPEGEQGLNVARLIGFLAGLPKTVAAATVNRFCGSSMQAVHMAAGAIQMGAGDCFVAAGIESMTRVPMMGFNPMLNPKVTELAPGAYMSMGTTAENVAAKYEIPRGDQDAFSVESHRRAAVAQAEGRFDDEIIPIPLAEGGVVDKDGCIRADASIEGLAGLDPAFQTGGTVTAGSSSPLTDGASACLVCTEEYAAQHGLEPLARITGIAVAGCAPEVMGLGPIAATRKVLKRTGLTMDKIDVIELNEAFASQSLACMRDLDFDPAKVNIDGGAIALGHPMGATGARITGKAAQVMKREGGKYALATQCIGGGQGIATIVEAL